MIDRRKFVKTGIAAAVSPIVLEESLAAKHEFIEYELIEYENRVEWRHNGKLHREDGPAREYANGDKEWFFEGQYHRHDGPAVERPNEGNFWVALTGILQVSMIERV